MESNPLHKDEFEFKEELIYYTNYKRINGYKRIIKRVPKVTPPLPESTNRQLEIPF